MVFPSGHVDSSWGKPHRVKVLSERDRLRGDEHPPQNVESGTAGALGDRLPDSGQDGHDRELVDAWLDGYTPHYSTVVWMGYPTKRVSMTDVHGEPQQGGYLPAEIWHAYMSMVTEGQTCSEFPSATEPLSYQPFFGKYASTGESSKTSEFNEEDFGVQEEKHSEKGSPQHSTHHEQGAGGTGGGGATGTGGPAPEARTPNEPSEPATPAPPGGAGGAGNDGTTGGAAPGQ